MKRMEPGRNMFQVGHRAWLLWIVYNLDTIPVLLTNHPTSMQLPSASAGLIIYNAGEQTKGATAVKA